ncbi:MAG: chromate resistance protein [Rubrobacter sp.]|nr:chromate resistance protein [Rubrobacter sp.]
MAEIEKTRWLILVYKLPREPSRHRVAVWRKLKTLGAIYLQDGVAVLPEDEVTKEQLEWLQLRVSESGGAARIWRGEPNTVAEDRNLVEEFRSSREVAYENLIESAARIERKAALGGEASRLMEELRKVEREFRTERKRDYFGTPLREDARAAIEAARLAARGESGEARDPAEGGC